MAGNNTIEANQDSPHIKTFSCPACAGNVKIRAVGETLTVVCEYCKSIIDTNNENYKVIEKMTALIKKRQVIQLGQRGKLFGSLWEMIGYMERTDQTGKYTWSEYLLFNPMKGFRWLTEYNGHWNFIVTTKETPKTQPKSNPIVAKYHNISYQLFNKGTATVSYVIGEFYWQVRINDKVDLLEFIAPPEILSVESNSEEIIWSIGQYTEADKIKEAFQIDKAMPIKSGIAPCQPSPIVADNASRILKFWLAFLGLFFIIQIGFCVGNHKEKVYTGQIEFSATDAQKTKVTPQFEIKDKNTTLDINFQTPLNNSWVEVGVDLVNDENGDTIEFEQGIEYYSGTDSDGAWTEGSTSSTETVPSIAKGKYHLNLEITAPGFPQSTPSNELNAAPNWNVTPPIILSVNVETGAVLWSNYYFAVILISIYPIIMIIRRRRIEVARWSESDFSPYEYSEE